MVVRYESNKDLKTLLRKKPLGDDSDDESLVNSEISTKSCSKKQEREENKNSFDI